MSARQSDNQLPSPQGPELQQTLLVTSLIIYGTMTVVGLLVNHYIYEGGIAHLFPRLDALGWQRVGTVALLGTGIILVASYFFEEFTVSFRLLKNAFGSLIAGCQLWVLLYLSVLSAVGEEILFRGTIQPQLGLVLTSILFGLLHIGPGGLLSAWSVWAMGAGLLLGWMTDAQGNLWAAMICHFLINFYSMVRLQYVFRRSRQQQEANDSISKAHSK